MRVLCFFLNFGGFYLLLSPLLEQMSVLPLVSYFLTYAFVVAGLCTAAVVAVIAQLFFTSLAWIAYRPVVATFLFLMSLSLGALFTVPAKVLGIGHSLTGA